MHSCKMAWWGPCQRAQTGSPSAVTDGTHGMASWFTCWHTWQDGHHQQNPPRCVANRIGPWLTPKGSPMKALPFLPPQNQRRMILQKKEKKKGWSHSSLRTTPPYWLWAHSPNLFKTKGCARQELTISLSLYVLSWYLIFTGTIGYLWIS